MASVDLGTYFKCCGWAGGRSSAAGLTLEPAALLFNVMRVACERAGDQSCRGIRNRIGKSEVWHLLCFVLCASPESAVSQVPVLPVPFSGRSFGCIIIICIAELKA